MVTSLFSSSSSSSSSSEATDKTVEKVIQKLTELGINFLALDFDQTILDIHTGGAWKGSLEELFPHIRPVYAKLITAALATHEIEVAVVTFSCQINIVRGILDRIILTGGIERNSIKGLGLVGLDGVVDTSTKIPIRGSDRSWKYDGSGSTDGKQPHMASAVEELESRRAGEQQQQRSSTNNYNNSTKTTSSSSALSPSPSISSSSPSSWVPITRSTTLLLDDDHRNIQHAINNGVRAIWFNPKRPDKLLPEMMKLV